MRLLTAAALLVILATPAIAGPLDTLQYRATFRTDQPSIPGPAQLPGETAYLLSGPPTFGVVAGEVRDWTAIAPAYPSAGFSVIHLGSLTPFTAAERVDNLEVNGDGRYTLDVEFRDASGRVSAVSLSGAFSAGWWGGHGSASPIFVPPDHEGGLGGPPWGTFWLGSSRYGVQLGYGAGGPFYTQNENGDWQAIWYAVDPIPIRNGGYWTEGSGSFYATITPIQTPEPGTLILAAMGVCVVWFARRHRPALDRGLAPWQICRRG